MTDFEQGAPNTGAAATHGELARGRECYRRRAWDGAYQSLARADRAASVGVDDLERLATSAYLTGRDDDYLNALDRAYQACLDGGDSLRAVRCAFWLGLRLVFRREMGRASGWFARAQRLLEREARACVEQGYLLLPVAEQHLGTGDWEGAHAAAAAAVEIGERFGEPDLIACARHLQGRVRLRQGQVAQGLALLDEAMVSVVAGELSPLVTGLIYCSVIEACQEVYALGRAREWTSALATWCAEQPEMVAFSGTCLVHRAEVMLLHGAWDDASEEARRGRERLSHERDQRAAAAAFYQQAEVHRLRGEFVAAEEAYRNASQRGREPQPGLALLRLAQGRTDAASAAIRRVVGATSGPLQRTHLLPACVEILLADGDIAEARRAGRELEEIARAFGSEVLEAMAAHARGALALAEENPQAALGSLRDAWQAWQRVDAPYSAARVRHLMGLACRALGDHEGAAMELDAARAVFERLGAAPDLVRIDADASGSVPPRGSHCLSGRELQVLRLVASGKTNKAIAVELFLSEKTIDRHVSNILAKLNVPSRAAATAYAYENKLI